MKKRLRDRSARELSDRLRQAVRIMAERGGLLRLERVPDGGPTVPRTPWEAPQGDAIARRLSAHGKSALLAQAERILAHQFDVLGLHGLSYGTPVDWQLDPLSGRRAALVHWSRVPYLNHDVVGDHKVTWEVNRHQWFITLGQAWVLTASPRYADAAVALLTAWLDANPPKNGINWCSALEVAFRVQSWIHGLRLFSDAPALSEPLRRRMVASVAVQIAHVEQNISTWFSPNTHLTGEALAMLATGCAWPHLPQASRWRSEGWRILCEQAPIQIRPDGVYFEQSPWYQSYTVDFYVLGMRWAALAGLPIPESVRALAHRASLALRTVTRPDGTVPRFGDDDGGRTLPITAAAFGDMTDSLWRAAACFADPALVPPATAGRDALLWLEGPNAFDRLSQWPVSTAKPVALRDGGWYVLNERSASTGLEHCAVLDGGPHGALSHAHSHADALSIDLTVHGMPMLVDAGTGAYVGPQRPVYRSTAAHNTVTVDGLDSSEQGTSFNWRSATDAVLDGFGTAPGACFVSAHHDGYHRLADPVRHTRTLLRFHQRYWLMLDTLDAQSTHRASLTLQAAPAVQIASLAPHRYEMTGRGAVEQAAVSLHVALDPRWQPRVEHRQVSPAYALEVAADALVSDADARGSTTFCTVLAAGDEVVPTALTRLETGDVWQVTHADGVDLIARPARGGTSLGPARFDGSALALLGGDEPHTIVAAGAGTLHLGERTFTLAADDVRLARRAPDGSWAMES